MGAMGTRVERMSWWRRKVASLWPESIYGVLFLVGVPVAFASMVFHSLAGVDQGIVVALVFGAWGLALWWLTAVRLAVPYSAQGRWMHASVRTPAGRLGYLVGWVFISTGMIAYGVLNLLLRPVQVPGWVYLVLTFAGLAASWVGLWRGSQEARMMSTAASGAGARELVPHLRVAMLVGTLALILSTVLVGWFVREIPTLFPMASFGGAVTSHTLAWSPDGKQLAVGNDNDTVAIWDLTTRHITWQTPCRIDDGRVAWSRDGTYLAAGCMYDIAEGNGVIGIACEVQVWSTSRHSLIATYRAGPGAVSPQDFAWSPTCMVLAILEAVGGDNSQINIYDIPDGRLVRSLPMRDWALSIAWSPNGQSFALAGRLSR